MPETLTETVTIPTRDELDAVLRVLQQGQIHVDSLDVNLSKIADEARSLAEPLSAEQAWLLHDFADSVRMLAETMLTFAGGIEGYVMHIWTEQRAAEERAAEDLVARA